jgi:hypothetical protein
MSPANAWELARVPNDTQYGPYGQQGVFTAMEGWRASIAPGTISSAPESFPPGTTYYESFTF